MAILFTDIAGFTKMMGKDEDRTLLALDQNRKIQKNGSESTGENGSKNWGMVLLRFFIQQVKLCCVHWKFKKEIHTIEDFEVRMGLHISEIVFTDTDAFGDGMNVASRVSDQAGAGEICFSEGIYQNIRNRENLAITALGMVEMKNVDHPFQLFKIQFSK